MKDSISRKERIRGMIIGTAVGDSLGLPAEGISRKRLSRLYRGTWRQRFIFYRGMISDDTEHTLFVAVSLICAHDSLKHFTRRLAWHLRLWLVTLPAGIGWATLRSIIKLWIGISPEKSGIYSAGNGPSMRVAPIGAFFSDNPEMMENYIEASTKLTHSDPKALTGARAVARTIAWIVRENLTERPSQDAFIGLLDFARNDKEWNMILERLTMAINEELPVSQFAWYIGAIRGISGYTYQTVPVVLYAWYRHFGDFRKSLISVLNCGGDTDTAGAIIGALAGAVSGEDSIPSRWINGIVDWPRGIRYMNAVADNLAETSEDHQKGLFASCFWPGVPLRNILFLIVVLFHGFRRLFPPY